MSSYLTSAEIEAIRLAEIKKQIADSIEKSKIQMSKVLRTEHLYKAEYAACANLEIQEFIADDINYGGNVDFAVATEGLLVAEGDAIYREELDFSALLQESDKVVSKLELELNEWIRKIDERAILTQKDEEDLRRVIAEVKGKMADETIDIEDRLKFAKMRIQSYLQGAAVLTVQDKEDIRQMYLEYCVLCNMFGMYPVEKFPYRIEMEVNRMKALVEKRRRDEYIMEAITTSMQELGYNTGDEVVLESCLGQMYYLDKQQPCELFVGNTGSGFMFEPVGVALADTLDKQRMIEHNANSHCKMYSKLEAKLKEKGVIINAIYQEEVEFEDMYCKEDVRKHQRKKQASATKERYFDGGNR